MEAETIEKAKRILCEYQGKPIRIMEVCGTHTHEIFKLGIRKLLPKAITLISGPGCPVCVTPVSYIDEAIDLAINHQVTIATFGDLIRVPGSEKSLLKGRELGAKIQMVYSPLDALSYAKEHKDEEVVFLSVGFETTTPGSALAVKAAKSEGVRNFSILTANKTMPNAYLALKNSADAFLYPGHVNAITGTTYCESLVNEGISGVVTGFTAAELLTALAVCVTKLSKGAPFFENCYPRVVTKEGSVSAKKLVAEVMEPCDSEWRGLSIIKDSGLKLRKEYESFDARLKYQLPTMTGKSNGGCRCGDVLMGKIKPPECPLFKKACTPLHPVGACMVSNEGACSAYYQYGGDL